MSKKMRAFYARFSLAVLLLVLGLLCFIQPIILKPQRHLTLAISLG
jgi:hypothetical protein